MAEDLYRFSKPEDSMGVPNPGSQQPARSRARATTFVRVYSNTQATRGYRIKSAQVEYAEVKALMESNFEKLQMQIRQEHEETRNEVRLTRFEILATLRSSPAQSIQLICELGLALCAFAILLRYLFSIEIVNTRFAFFTLFSLGIYWLMAYVKARRENGAASSAEER